MLLFTHYGLSTSGSTARVTIAIYSTNAMCSDLALFGVRMVDGKTHICTNILSILST